MAPTDPTVHFGMLEKAAQAFGQAYFIYHTQGKTFTYLNPAFVELWGLSTDTIQHQAGLLQPTLHPEDVEFLTNHYEALLSGQARQNIEFRVVHANGEVRWLNLACLPIKENGADYLSGYVTDFTKLREYTYDILKFNAKKNATLEILSHDLAAPFNNIQGLVRLVENRQELVTEQTKHMLNLIKEDAQRGSNLIRDFVNNEFLESSQVELHKERIDVLHRLEVMLDDYMSSDYLVIKHFKLESDGKPIYMYLDEMKFMQVLNNLVSNSIKFTPDNGTITLILKDLDDKVYFAVSDNGIGIPDTMKPLIFDKFTKARREGIRGEKSVGMGMSIIRNIVELHNGRIWFDSTEGKGTTFHIELPKE